MLQRKGTTCIFNAPTHALWQHVLHPITVPWSSPDRVTYLCGIQYVTWMQHTEVCSGKRKSNKQFYRTLSLSIHWSRLDLFSTAVQSTEKVENPKFPLRTDAAVPAFVSQKVFSAHHCKPWPGVPSDRSLQSRPRWWISLHGKCWSSRVGNVAPGPGAARWSQSSISRGCAAQPRTHHTQHSILSFQQHHRLDFITHFLQLSLEFKKKKN